MSRAILTELHLGLHNAFTETEESFQHSLTASLFDAAHELVPFLSTANTQHTKHSAQQTFSKPHTACCSAHTPEHSKHAAQHILSTQSTSIGQTLAVIYHSVAS